MPPAYDFRCETCEQEQEIVCKMADRPSTIGCPSCGGDMLQVPSLPAVLGDEASWLSSVKEVVNKDGGPHCQKFLQEPNRANYRAWMKGENLRPMEPGEQTWKRPAKRDRRKVVNEVMKMRQQRKAITVA